MTTNEERIIPNTEQTPAPETAKTGNPPLEDQQLEDVAGGFGGLVKPFTTNEELKDSLYRNMDIGGKPHDNQ
jgi:hypothetical protein